MGFTCYQVKYGLSFNHTKSQWVDLGINTEACMTRPETCGVAGGAISVWINVIDCAPLDGIVSSYQGVGTTGIRIYCHYQNIRYETHILPIFPHKLEKCYKSSS